MITTYHKLRVGRFAGCVLAATIILQTSTTQAFEGHINATLTRGGQSDEVLYTVGTNYLRVELTATNWPNPVDILDRQTGALTLVFPHNRSFVRLQPGVKDSPLPPGLSAIPGGSAAVHGPQPPPANLSGAPAMPAMPNVPAAGGMPAMPVMPMMPMDKPELKATGEKTNLLGLACEKFVIKYRGETMDIWATDQLLPFQPYQPNQPGRFGPQMIEELWPALLKAKKLFPILATLRFDNEAESLRFQVESMTPEPITDPDGNLFRPPTGWFEIQPLPF